jgi:hypothetical protein
LCRIHPALPSQLLEEVPEINHCIMFTQVRNTCKQIQGPRLSMYEDPSANHVELEFLRCHTR